MKLIIAVALFLAMTVCASANDSADETAAGGLKLRKEQSVLMKKERLYISPKAVRVEYEFLNTSKNTVVSEVAFPIPPVAFAFQDPGGSREFSDFKAWINDVPIQVEKEVRAFVKDREVTEALRKAKIPIETFGDFEPAEQQHPIATLKPEVRDALVKAGALKKDGQDYWPKWEVPAATSMVTCPKCSQRFPFADVRQETGNPIPHSSTAAPDAPAALTSPPQPVSTPPIPIQEQPLQQGGTRAKSLLLFFILLVIVLVGLRLWADGKKRTVPYPNFITTAAQGVAVSWDNEVVLLDHAGHVTGRLSLPEDTTLTQLLYVGDELWYADHTTNSIRRLRNGSWETVVNGGKRFRGAFKFVVDLKSGEIFVADSSNHTIHQFMTDGSYVRSFGREGKKPGELKFPNSILFDRDGNLIVVNTNCFRIDLFSRQGDFIKTIANVAAIDDYRFPTLLAKTGDRFAFLHTVDLRRAVVMLYGDDGQAIGKFPVPRRLDEAGDIAAWDGKVLVSDNKLRKVYAFSAADRTCLGSFSDELDQMGAQATRLDNRYGRISGNALYALLICCLPVIYLYYQTRQNEERRLGKVDCGNIIPGTAMLGVATDRRKLAYAAGVLILSMMLMLFCVPLLRANRALVPLVTIGNAVLLLGMFRFLMERGINNPSRRDLVEKLARAAAPGLSKLLSPGEQVVACTALRRSAWLKQPFLLLLTTERMLLLDFAALHPKVYSRLGYGDIDRISLQPVRMGSPFLNRLVKTESFRIKLDLKEGAGMPSLQLIGADRPLLEQIKGLLEAKFRQAAALGFAALCPTCFSSLDAAGCPNCRTNKKQDWKPLLLSLLYPGLGQFYNREIKKGCLISIGFTSGVLALTMPVTKIVDRSAEILPGDMALISYSLLMSLVIYAVALADADFVGRQGRRLFSMSIFKK